IVRLAKGRDVQGCIRQLIAIVLAVAGIYQCPDTAFNVIAEDIVSFQAADIVAAIDITAGNGSAFTVVVNGYGILERTIIAITTVVGGLETLPAAPAIVAA